MRLSVRPPLFVVVLAAIGGCTSYQPLADEAGPFDAMRPDAGFVFDTGPRPDVPLDAPDLREALLAELGTSVWSALQTRYEPDHRGPPETPDGGVPDGGMAFPDPVERAYELRFDRSTLTWTEIRNPFGPARRRRVRAFVVDADGRSVTTSVLADASDPDDPAAGRGESWTFEVVAGTPRELRITNARGEEEVFVEGAWAPPTTGLTAEVRTFDTMNTVHSAACLAASLGDTQRRAILDFARGLGEAPTHLDVTAGVALLGIAMASTTPISDLDGYDRLGGTLIPAADQGFFVVRYTGTITHDGGNLRLQELDDTVGTGLLAFVGPSVGSTTLPTDIFLEVQSTSSPDATGDTAQQSIAAGDVPFELVIWRCGGGADVDVEIDPGGGFRAIGTDLARPAIDTTLFPL